MSARNALVLLMLLLVRPVMAEVVWLEAERFDDHGGWVTDAQFVDQMGSPYLLANGMSSPVADAVTGVMLPRAGEYRLWVRSKDWLPEYHPGRFQLSLDGRPVEKTFGSSGQSDWHWEDGGMHRLPASFEIRLVDLTGYYGRCDAILLADDAEFVPPTDVAAIAMLREEHGGVSRLVEVMPECDVVVVGGGLAGCTAAVAAARNGASTVLIQNRPVLGGNASTEILVPPVGAWPGLFRSEYPLDPRETGLIEEYRTIGNQRVSEGELYSNRLLRFVELEPNLDLYLNTHATGVVMKEESTIGAVDAIHVRSGRRMRFPGRVFIDCTGDAVVGVAAGAEFRHGKEPKSMYDEPWAPDEPSRHTMGNGLKYYAADTGSPQPFEALPWAFKFPSCDSIGPGRHPRLTTSIDIGYQWTIEIGGTRDTYADAEEIRDDLFRLVYGLWDHTKNHCENDKPRAADYKLAWVGHVAGKRENRRLIGDCVLTQNHIGEQTLFADRVAFGAWSVDDHYSAGFFHDGPTGRHFDGADHHYKGVPYSIPFRCLYSRNVDNLLMAGRNISASHLALANTRVMLTCAVLGHAAGTAAAICCEEATSPRGVYENHIRRLQQRLLKEGATIIGLAADDPADLAPKASVAASSVGTDEAGRTMAATNATNGIHKAIGTGRLAETNAWAPEREAAGPHWIELTWPEPVEFNVVHVAFQTAERAPREFSVEVRQKDRWEPVARVAANRHRRHVLGLDRVRTSALRVVLAQPAAVCEIRVYAEPERAVEIARRAHRNMQLPDQGPWLPWPEPELYLKLDGIALDDSQAEADGYWTNSTFKGRFLGSGYLHDGNEGKGEKSLTFRPGLEKPGRFEVRLAYVPNGNRATNTPVTINAQEGATTVEVNQRREPSIDKTFISLGTFTLDAKSTIVVTNTDTDGYVVVDAVQLLPAD